MWPVSYAKMVFAITAVLGTMVCGLANAQNPTIIWNDQKPVDATSATAEDVWVGKWFGKWSCITRKISGPLRLEIERGPKGLQGTVEAGGDHYLKPGVWAIRNVRPKPDRLSFSADDNDNYVGPKLTFTSGSKRSVDGSDTMAGGRHPVVITLERH